MIPPPHVPAQQYIFSTFAFLGFIAVCIPFPWHWQAQNVGTCMYMAWAAIGCLNQFINSVIWAKNAINYAPVWCDISVRLIIGVGLGIPAASLCINRRLYYIAAGNSVSRTKTQIRRAVLVDLAIGIGIPLLQMVLQYVVQGHRFDIYQEIGCFPAQRDVWLVIPIVLVWPIIIGLVSMTYCTRTIYHFVKRRSVFKELLAKNSDMSQNRYLRLMLLAGIEALTTVPIATYFLYRDVIGMVPYYGWADMHWGFHRVSQFPSILWRMNPQAVFGLEITRWSPVLCAFIFFFFFAFAEEARKQYRLAYTSVAKRLGYSTADTMSTGMTGSTTDMRAKSHPHLLSNGKNMPIIQKETTTKRDSFGSFNLTIVDVSGALDDYKAPIYSPTASSSGSYSPQRTHSSTSISSPTVDGSSHTTLDSAIPRPQPVLDITNVSRRSAESSPIRPSRPPSLHLPVDMV